MSRAKVLPALTFLVLVMGLLMARVRLHAEPPTESEQGAGFWSFRPVADPSVPDVANTRWPKSPIDHFVLRRLEKENLTPVEPASKRVWVRRTTFDLIGLPPTPSEVTMFLDDTSLDAHAKVVDRLLASPRYGERWSRYWLDVARYAEEQHIPVQNKYEALPEAYKYRDWVVNALNQDLPYDEFILQQVAGDLVDGLGHEGWDAVGFFALGPIYQTDGGEEDDLVRVRYDTIDDKLDALSRGFLGLTLACARCHDHKFDPISIEDYYSLAGVFYNTDYVTQRWLDPPDVVKRYLQAQDKIEQQTKRVTEAKQGENSSEKVASLSAELEQLKAAVPAKPDFYAVHSLVDIGSEDVPVAVRGNPLRRGKMVPRQFLGVLREATDSAQRFINGSGRLELAHSIADRNNPLTARVMVNRLWQHHFGKGLVRTPDNFGTLGEPPTHQALLDWLAHLLMEDGWSLKRLHREIVLSATYRLSSRFNEHNFKVDGDNKWLWRMSPRRLDVEAWRDALLTVTGEIDLQLAGPSVDDVLTASRRTLYAPVRRDPRFANDKFLRLFDFPNPWLSNSQRTVTTIPLQQLFMLNGEFVTARARALAARLANLSDDHIRIERAFDLLFARPATKEEVTLALEFLSQSRSDAAPENLSLWEQYAQVLLCTNEFLYVR